MSATNWDGSSNLGGNINLATSGKMRQRTAAGMTAAGSSGEAGYTSSLFSALVNLVEAETDAAKQRDAISALVTYHAAVAATSVQDRASLAHTLARHSKDINLMLDFLFGRFGPVMPLDKPTQDQLAEIENVVALKRATAGKAALPGTSY